jgi:hypothetical protein
LAQPAEVPVKTGIALLFLFALMVGCTSHGHLYAVQGPLSGQKPAPAYIADFTGAAYSGNVSTVLSDGEMFKGRWQTVSRKQSAKEKGPVAGDVIDMASSWDAVYGQGFYVAHVLGAQIYARSVITGNKGTELKMEIYRPPDVEVGSSLIQAMKGVAKDSKGNIYKLAF